MRQNDRACSTHFAKRREDGGLMLLAKICILQCCSLSVCSFGMILSIPTNTFSPRISREPTSGDSSRSIISNTISSCPSQRKASRAAQTMCVSYSKSSARDSARALDKVRYPPNYRLLIMLSSRPAILEAVAHRLLVQRWRMFSKIENFIENNRLEQAERLAGRLPSYEQYLKIRYGVTGVRMFSLLLE